MSLKRPAWESANNFVNKHKLWALMFTLAVLFRKYYAHIELEQTQLKVVSWQCFLESTTKPAVDVVVVATAMRKVWSYFINNIILTLRTSRSNIVNIAVKANMMEKITSLVLSLLLNNVLLDSLSSTSPFKDSVWWLRRRKNNKHFQLWP